jgi:hypothetical protein
LGTARALFDDLARVGARFDTLILFWLGEPLIHPDVGAIHAAALRAAGEHGIFGRVELHTNATHLTPDRVRAALNASPVPQVWHLTIDAATAPTYAKVKGRDLYTRVEANVEAFLAGKARLGAPNPRVVLQFIVGRNNAHEADAFRARWGRTLDRLGLPWRAAAQEVPAGDDAIVFYRQLDAPSPEAQEAENAVYRETVARLGLALPRPERSPARVGPAEGSIPCGCLWKAPTVGWDGRVTTCTRDNRHENALGNLHEIPFSQLWWGSRMRGVRARVARGEAPGLPACEGCFIPLSANSTSVTAEEMRLDAAWNATGTGGGATG